MENFLFPEMTDRAAGRLRKQRGRRRKPFITFIGPGGEGQADEKPGHPRPVPPQAPPKPTIQWNERPEPRVFRNKKVFRTDGPVKVRHSSNTVGLDGLQYRIKWHPLDKNGKRAPVFEKPGNRGESVTSSAHLGNPSDEEFKPPWNHPHGWEVELRIPPQQPVNANSAGHDLDVFLPKGKRQLPKR